jgi:hypothetical protein
MNRANEYQIPRMQVWISPSKSIHFFYETLEIQVDFYKAIVVPAFNLMFNVIGDPVKFMWEGVKDNESQWIKLKENGVVYKIGHKG